MAALWLGGCGPSRGAPRWVDAEAAALRCTVAGPERIQPMLAAVPGPEVPRGFYARRMDPMALDDLGYQRNHVVCASLIAPAQEAIAEGSAGLDHLLEVHSQVSIAAMRVGSRCACEVARSIRVEHLIARCASLPTQRDCTVSATDRERMQAVVAPVREAVADLALPLVHWRLSGVTDRPGWFLRKQADLVPRFPGGSVLFVPGQGLPARSEYRLIERLLAVEDVVAVVRQDGDGALLVLREVGDALVLDHFAFPEVAPERSGLLALYTEERAQVFVDALAPPEEAGGPALDPRRGNLFELRHGALERVDDAQIVGSGLSRRRYRASDAARQQPPVLVDRVTVQAPFGEQGRVLRLRLELSEAGKQWAQTLPSAMLSPTLDEVDPSDEAVTFVAPRGVDLPFVLRGTATEAVWIHGIHGISDVLAKLEQTYPSSIAGKIDDIRVDLAAGPWPAKLETGAGLEVLRERLETGPHQLTGGLREGRTVLDLRLAPR